MYRTRFAPSPTGALHMGHALSALLAWHMAGKKAAHSDRSQKGFILRFEDIDHTRCRAHFLTEIEEDLRWLGLSWLEPVLYQSQRLDIYQAALARLQQAGLIYPCFCTRRQMKQDWADSLSAPHLQTDPKLIYAPGMGPDGPLYSRRCAHLTETQRADAFAAQTPYAWRLDMAQAIALTGPLYWQDLRAGKQQAVPEIFGDVIIARKDIATSYHLAVTLDDAAQNIECVTRGEDLFPATHIHRLLQSLLDLPTPLYLHHPLLQDDQGERLAKRRNSQTLSEIRQAGGRVNQDVLPLFAHLFQDILRAGLV